MEEVDLELCLARRLYQEKNENSGGGNSKLKA